MCSPEFIFRDLGPPRPLIVTWFKGDPSLTTVTLLRRSSYISSYRCIQISRDAGWSALGRTFSCLILRDSTDPSCLQVRCYLRRVFPSPPVYLTVPSRVRNQNDETIFVGKSVEDAVISFPVRGAWQGWMSPMGEVLAAVCREEGGGGRGVSLPYPDLKIKVALHKQMRI